MKKKVFWSIIFLLMAIMILTFGLINSRSFFAFNHPIKGDVLIIEAWIPPFEVEQAIPSIMSDTVSNVIIIGQDYSNDYDPVNLLHQRESVKSMQPEKQVNGGIWLFTHSSLAFNLTTVALACESEDSLSIMIKAKGSKSAGYFAHFNLVVNGKYIGGAFTTAGDSLYPFIIEQPDEGIQSLSIHFDNDLVHQNSDRNLNLLSVKIGETLLNLCDENSLLIKDDGKSSNGFNSQADQLKNYLIQIGIPSSKLTTISFEPVSRNQTLAAAKSFKASNFSRGIKSINIVSSGLHSRRSWITYKKILGKNCNVGVVQFEPSDFKKGTREDNFLEFQHLIDESFSYLYNWIFLSFGWA